MDDLLLEMNVQATWKACKSYLSQMKALIIDDNKLARMAMRQLTELISDLEVMGECADALEAFRFLQESPVDLLLLDIEMPGMSGLELTRLLHKQKPIIVFTTANKDYAIEAFELNVADYLVKPVGTVRFLQSIEKVRETLNSHKQQVQQNDHDFAFIKDNGVLKKVHFNEIHCVEAMGDYVKLHTNQKFHVIHATLKNVEEKLPDNFFRVHRSYIIAVDKIESLHDGVIQMGKIQVPVADAYRTPLLNRLKFL
jgi:two-component system LytT family response regulator